MAVLAGSVVYNALLAWAAARNFGIGQREVIAAELGLLAAACAIVVTSGRRQGDSAAVLLLLFFTLTAFLISIFAGGIFPTMARNGAIIALFLMLGTRITPSTLNLSFAVISGLVAAGLLFEILSPSTYVRLFQPSNYYELTRGIEPLEAVDGLFRNASGFEGRFAILDLLGHRASSLFLEPVSLGNFGVVLVGFLLCFWADIGRNAKFAYIALAMLVLVATNSRLLFGFMLLGPVIYYAAAWLDRAPRLLILPAILLLGTLVYAAGPSVEDDNLVGRIGKTMLTLTELDVRGVVGLQPFLASDFSDSGFTFIIYASSGLGLVAIWLFVSLIVPAGSLRQRRAGLFLCLYYFVNLLISGNSVFSIKVAALLWLLIGLVSRPPGGVDSAQGTDPKEPGAATAWRTDHRESTGTARPAW